MKTTKLYKVDSINDPVFSATVEDAGLERVSNRVAEEMGDVLPPTFVNEMDITATLADLSKNNLELHLYTSEDSYLSSNYIVEGWEYINSSAGVGIQINIHDDVRNLGFFQGKYICKYKLNYNLVGNYNSGLYIKNISADRTELRLVPQTISNEISINISNLSNIPKIDSENRRNELGLNLYNNRYNTIINWLVDYFYTTETPSIIVKLKEPLENTIIENTNCSIVIPLAEEVIIPIELIASTIPINVSILSPANFNATPLKETKIELKYSNYIDLIGNNTNVSSLIQTYISSSNSARLNIDYRDFSNYVFYGSAQKRLEVFKYKLTKIENYSTLLDLLYSTLDPSQQEITGSAGFISNVQSLSSSISETINSFDGYEKYLYYESSSYESSSYGEYYPTTWPKINSLPPYKCYSVTSSIAENWFAGIYESASYYDKTNKNQLVKILPRYFKTNPYNNDGVTFVHMVGHQFDNLLPYVYNMLYNRYPDESVDSGLSKDLIYQVLCSYGWDGENDAQFDDLWYYTLGTNEQGQYHESGSYTVYKYVNSGSLPTSDISIEIWKRILNNLPYLNKTKGTIEGIRALMNCYGIPQTLINIKEYGGPNAIDTNSVYIHDKYNYALKFDSTKGSSIEIASADSGIGSEPTSIEFRFKLLDIWSSDYILVQWGEIKIYTDESILYVTDGTTSQQITSKSICKNRWYSVLIQIDRTNVPIYTFHIYSQDNGIIYSYDTVSFISDVSTKDEFIGFGSLGIGYLQELRVWYNEVLDSKISRERVLSPTSFYGNTVSSSYDNLVHRYCLGSDLNKLYDSSNYISSQAPNKNYHIYNALYDNITPADYYPNNEIYYTPWPDVSGNRQISNKIRIESSTKDGQLSLTKRVDTPAYDIYPLDTNKLGIYLSTTNEINEDIAEQIGATSLDDYIGGWEYLFSSSYQDLTYIRNLYLSKYSGSCDSTDYYRLVNYFDNTLFKQIRKILPARVNGLVGAVIEPHLLNRSKVSILKSDPSFTNNCYSASVDISIHSTLDSIYELHDIIIESDPFPDTVMIDFVSIDGVSDLGLYNPSQYNFQNLIFYNSDSQLVDIIVPASSDYVNGVQQIIQTSVTSNRYSYDSGNGNLLPAQVNHDYHISLQNLYYNGCKISSTSINSYTAGTPDKKSAVELFMINPMIPAGNIVVKNTSANGILQVESVKPMKNTGLNID